MRLSIGAWSEEILNNNVRISIHKLNMWGAGNSARPPGYLWLHRLIVDYSIGLLGLGHLKAIGKLFGPLRIIGILVEGARAVRLR